MLNTSLTSADFPKLNLPYELPIRYYRESRIANVELSVVIPVRNRPQLVVKAIKSVLQLDESGCEIIVVDDGSTDATLNKLVEFEDPSVAIISHRESSGANVARNIGIAMARGQAIAFLDSDDQYSQGRVRKPLNILSMQADVGIVISSFISSKNQNESRVCLPDQKFTASNFHRLLARYVLPPTTSGLTVRKSALLEVGGFDLSVKRMQDRDLVLRLSQMWGGFTLSDKLWTKQWQPDSITANQSTFRSDLLKFIHRHPIYFSEEIATRDYLVARYLISSVLRGRIIGAVIDYTYFARSLGYSLTATVSLFCSYRRVQKNRRAEKIKLNTFHQSGEI